MLKPPTRARATRARYSDSAWLTALRPEPRLTRTPLARRLATSAGIVAVEQRLLRIESMALVVGEAVGLSGKLRHAPTAGVDAPRRFGNRRERRPSAHASRPGAWSRGASRRIRPSPTRSPCSTFGRRWVGTASVRDGRGVSGRRDAHGRMCVTGPSRFQPAETPAMVGERLEAVVQALRFRQRRERLECGVLDLPNPFAGDAEGSADLTERPRLTAI